MMTLLAIQNIRTRHEWAEIINADWRKSIEGIIRTGRDLIAAQGELSRREYTKMVKIDLPFSPRTARQLKQIERYPAFTKRPPSSALPSSWTVRCAG